MYQTVAYKNLAGDYILIDVRSPGEHEYATIPGAISLPIFDDEQRSRIGQVYVNESIEKAKQIGVSAVAQRLPYIYERILGLNKDYDKLVFFCAKGGMRSASLVALMVELGVKAVKLKEGYKGYRAFINEQLPQLNKKLRYIVIHGKTGTGKTRILEKLMDAGYDVLDLEKAANHRGSLLGSVGLGKENSQKLFESLVYESLKKAKNSWIFVEGESKRIGNSIIPQYIFESMVQGTHLLVEAPLALRAETLIKDYTASLNFQDEIISAIENMEKYIGEKQVKRYSDLVRLGDFKEAAMELMVKYYDPMYSKEFNNYHFDLIFTLESVGRGSDVIEKWFADWRSEKTRESLETTDKKPGSAL